MVLSRELRQTIMLLKTTSRGFHYVNKNNNNHVWSVLKNLLNKNLDEFKSNYACLLLNVPNSCSNQFNDYKYIWDGATIRVAVDGAANFVAKKKLLHETDIVCGDFDSAEPSLIQRLRYKAKSLTQNYDQAKIQTNASDTNNNHNNNTVTTTNTATPSSHEPETIQLPQVIDTPDQNETDFTKALRVVLTTKPEINYFFVLYYVDGTRLDHLFAIINTLHVIRKKIFLVNLHSDTISWLLHPGTHIINKVKGRDLCSIVPFAGKASVKTRGLMYDIQPNNPLSFGGSISTSNICQHDKASIIIETNNDLLWSLDLTWGKSDNVMESENLSQTK